MAHEERIDDATEAGNGSPLVCASTTSPQVIAEVPMSMTTGSGSQGNAIANGLVPMMRSAPPNGATGAVVLVVCSATKPCRAARST